MFVGGLAICKNGPTKKMTGVSDLQVFYLTMALVILTIVFVLWADAIRAKKEKKR